MGKSFLIFTAALDLNCKKKKKPNKTSDEILISTRWRRSKEAFRLTGFADPDLLQVGLLDVVEVLGAGDVEAISEAQVELLQLDLGQEMIQPLSVFVHQHHLADLPWGSKVIRQLWDLFVSHDSTGNLKYPIRNQCSLWVSLISPNNLFDGHFAPIWALVTMET